nr:MAG TPA: hypothetical protein [Caudoviricetes sp.]
MRIIFSALACPLGRTLSDTLHALQRSAAVPICPAWSALHLARPALLPVLCGLPGCAGRCRKPPAGYTAAAQPRPVSLSTTEKIKKAQKITPPLSPISKIPPQKQKDLYKGSAFCAILALQALKGRNLQWLKIK